MSTPLANDEAGSAPNGTGTGPPPAPRPGNRIETAPARVSRRAEAKTLIGAVLVLIGLFLVWGGIAPLTESPDADGYYMSDPFTLDRPSSAVVATDMDLLRGRWETLTEESFAEMFMATPNDIRMQGIASEDDAIFLGIAPTSAVNEYLDGVAYEEITEWNADQAAIVEVEYTSFEGTVPPAPPRGETFWAVSASGMETQTLDWTIEDGDWTAVVMNADGSSGVAAELAFGALPPSGWDALHWTSFAAGLVLVAGGAVLAYLGLRRR